VPKGAVVDAVHTDLVDPTDGRCLIDPGGLVACCSPETKYLFINSLALQGKTNGDSAAAVASAIRACDRLEVVCLIECRITEAVVEALVSKGPTLKGVIVDKCFNVGLESTDTCWAQLLQAAPNLLWLQLSFMHHPPFAESTWAALPPSLHVAIVTNCRVGTTAPVPAANKEAFRKAVKALPLVKWAKEDMNDGTDCQRAWQWPASTPYIF
jgi:hypothetical protein